jgi:hypothetical protein
VSSLSYQGHICDRIIVSVEDVEDGDEGRSMLVSGSMVGSSSVDGRGLSGSQDGNCASPAGPYRDAAAADTRPKTPAPTGWIRRNRGYRNILLPAFLV